MTSFTRKLFQRDPAAADAFYRAQQFETKTVYGRHNTLACFTPAHHQVEPVFGRRQKPPVQPAYECWSPAEDGKVAKPKAIVRAPDSFQARKVFASHHGIAVSDCCARLVK